MTVADCIREIQRIAADPNYDMTWTRTRIVELCLEAQGPKSAIRAKAQRGPSWLAEKVSLA